VKPIEYITIQSRATPRMPASNGFRGSPESVDTLIELILLVCPALLAAM
jgi:hypothetical protein